MLRITIISILLFAVVSVDSKHKHHQKNEPEFLRNVTSAAKKSFFDISKNQGLSIEQKDEKLVQWAKDNNVEEKFNEFTKNEAIRKEELSQNVTRVISRLADAKVQVDKVLGDKTLTKTQQQEKIKEISKEYPQEVPTLFHIGKLFSHDGKKDGEKEGKQIGKRNGGRQH